MQQVFNRTSRDRIPAATAAPLAPAQNPIRSARRVSSAVLITAAGLLALVPNPASAAFGPHTFSTTFAGSGTNALSNPNSVAVDESTGDVYVTDPANHRVEKFDSSGNFLLMFGKNVNSGTGDPNICTNAGSPTDICNAGTSTTSPGGFEELVYVAVDNSSGPSAGDVYVGDAEYPAPISKFDSSGHLITAWGGGGQLVGPPAQEWFTIYGGMTVDGSGNLYVYSYGEMFKFSQSGAWEETHSTPAPVGFAGMAVDPARDIYLVDSEESVEKRAPFPTLLFFGLPASQSLEPRALAVDSTSGDLYVDGGGTELQRYASACDNACTAIESFGSGHLNAAKGLAVDARSGTVYVANAGDGDVAVFTPLIFADVVPRPVSDPGPTSVTLNGEVDPAGGPSVTECYFEYGTAENSYTLGSETCMPNPAEAPPSSNFTVRTPVHAEISNLQPLSIYHYRLVAGNANGITRGEDQVALATPKSPTVDSISSANVTSNSATLNAEINPGLGPTIYRFQYGTTESYGAQTFPSNSIGDDEVDHLASAEVVGLASGTTYHFRVAATNLSGTTFGPDSTFTTPAPPSVIASSVSAITRTSATLDAQIDPQLSSTAYHFEYGTTSAHGSDTPESLSIGSDDIVHAVSQVIDGLTPGTTYHYSVRATNAIGAVNGVDGTFSTEMPEEEVTKVPIVCKKGHIKRQGKCVKKGRPRSKHHRGSHNHA